jgi:CBS domain-containing protein
LNTKYSFFVVILVLSSWLCRSQSSYELGWLPSVTLNKKLPKDYVLNFKVESRQVLESVVFDTDIRDGYNYILTDFTTIVGKKISINTSLNLGYLFRVENNTIIGVITDGDIRRALQRNADLREFVASDLMSLQPKSISSAELATKALELMEKHNITQLVVLEEGKYAGFVHLHDLLKEGIF